MIKVSLGKGDSSCTLLTKGENPDSYSMQEQNSYKEEVSP